MRTNPNVPVTVNPISPCCCENLEALAGFLASPIDGYAVVVVACV